MKYLLVGGPAHGEQHEVDNPERIVALHVAVLKPLSTKMFDPNENVAPKIRAIFGHPDGEKNYDVHIYRRETARHGDLSTTLFFIWEGKKCQG